MAEARAGQPVGFGAGLRVAELLPGDWVRADCLAAPQAADYRAVAESPLDEHPVEPRADDRCARVARLDGCRAWADSAQADCLADSSPGAHSTQAVFPADLPVDLSDR